MYVCLFGLQFQQIIISFINIGRILISPLSGTPMFVQPCYFSRRCFGSFWSKLCPAGRDILLGRGLFANIHAPQNCPSCGAQKILSVGKWKTHGNHLWNSEKSLNHSKASSLIRPEISLEIWFQKSKIPQEISHDSDIYPNTHCAWEKYQNDLGEFTLGIKIYLYRTFIWNFYLEWWMIFRIVHNKSFTVHPFFD